MNWMGKALIGLAMAMPAALAVDRAFVDQMMTAARSIERDANAVSQALKGKAKDEAALEARIDAMGAEVDKLKKLMAEYELSHPAKGERERADWERLRESVKLLELFHGEKKALATTDLAKNRSLVRTHAKGLAERAKRLQRTAGQLWRG